MDTLHRWSLVAIAALAIVGCTDWLEPYFPGGNGNGHGYGHGDDDYNTPSGKLTERTDWKVEYKGRTDFHEQDGSVSKVEEFSFKYTGNGYFILRTFAPDDIKNYYNNDLQSMMDSEVEYVVTQALNEGGKFYENDASVFDSSIKTAYYDIIIHGDYTAYLIEIGKDGKPTYNYAKAGVHVDEEMPEDSFLRWIGNWHVSDGHVGYDIVISSCEANYFYYVDGWETGDSVQEQMTMERDWIFARYRNSNLYFYGQYLMSYEDESLQDSGGNNVWVDQMFVGTYLIDSSGSNGVVDEEGAYSGYDIAHTAILEDGQVVLEPEHFTFENGFNAIYLSMRYSRYCYDDGSWAHYNDSGVPTFTDSGMTMKQLPGTKAQITHTRTRQLVKRTQPQVHADRLHPLRDDRSDRP